MTSMAEYQGTPILGTLGRMLRFPVTSKAGWTITSQQQKLPIEQGSPPTPVQRVRGSNETHVLEKLKEQNILEPAGTQASIDVVYRRPLPPLPHTPPRSVPSTHGGLKQNGARRTTEAGALQSITHASANETQKQVSKTVGHQTNADKLKHRHTHMGIQLMKRSIKKGVQHQVLMLLQMWQYQFERSVIQATTQEKHAIIAMRVLRRSAGRVLQGALSLKLRNWRHNRHHWTVLQAVAASPRQHLQLGAHAASSQSSGWPWADCANDVDCGAPRNSLSLDPLPLHQMPAVRSVGVQPDLNEH